MTLTPLKIGKYAIEFVFLGLLYSKPAIDLIFASWQLATPGFIPIWKVNGVCEYVILIVSRIASYATNVMYLLMFLKKTGNKITGRNLGHVC